MKPSHLGWLVTWVCPKIRHVLVGENQEPSEIFMVYHPSFPKTVAILRYILIPSEIRPRHIATPASLGCWPCLGNVHSTVWCVDKPFLAGGWLNPSEKWWSSSVGMIIQYIVWKIKNVWNHQPVLIVPPIRSAIPFITLVSLLNNVGAFFFWLAIRVIQSISGEPISQRPTR